MPIIVGRCGECRNRVSTFVSSQFAFKGERTMTKKEAAARKVLTALVTFPRTPIRTVAEFINAHGIEGQMASDLQGLSWAARSRHYDAFQRAAILRGVYGWSFQKAEARPEPIAPHQPKKQLSQKDQKAARLLVVQMVKLARTPVKTVAEFIVANGISGTSFGEAHGLSQAADNRLYASFKKVSHMQREAQRIQSIHTIFSERSLTIRNDYVHRLLLKKGQAASDDLINRVRSELVVASPTRPEARLRIVG
jgi:hypothetical protein